jgi:hypothetical protein
MIPWPVRWLKLIIYLALSYVVLTLSLPRASVWAHMALGPASWVPDPPHPLVWAGLSMATIVFVAALVVDVGLRLWRLPWQASAAMVLVFALSLAAWDAEKRGRLGWTSDALAASPSTALSSEIERLRAGLSAYYREHQAFPLEQEKLEGILRAPGERPATAPYLYRGLRRRPLALIVRTAAQGPVTALDPDLLPGSVVYAVSADGQAYWLTAVAGSGAPAAPEFLKGSSGGPAVVSNLPGGRLR